MNILSKIVNIFYSPKKVFSDLKKDGLHESVYLLILLAGILGLVSKSSHFFEGLSSAGRLLQSTAGPIITFLILPILLTFFLKIYEDKARYKEVFKSMIFASLPIFLLSYIMLYSEKIYTYVRFDKPLILLMVITYSIILLHKGLKEMIGVKSSHATTAIILFLVFLYIFQSTGIDVIIFYSVAMGFLFLKRKKFTAQGAVLLYKTKLGLKNMERIAKKHPKTLGILGQIGIWSGFLLMIAMAAFLVDNAIKLLLVPNTMPAVAPVLPGIPVPGTPISLPLWYGISSIFLVVLIHEFSHGVIARLYNIKVKSSGFLFMGPIIGAFVEPDEKQMEKKKRREQLAVLGAGPFSNVLLAIIALLIMNFALAPAIGSAMTPDGAQINILANTSAEKSGLMTGQIIKSVDGIDIIQSDDLYDYLADTAPGENLTIITENSTHYAILTQHPEKEGKGYLGMTAQTNYKVKEDVLEKYGMWPFQALQIIYKFFTWLFIISLGIGVANLLPLGPVDGGRMLLIILGKYFKKEKAKKIWTQVSVGFFVLLIFVLLFPLLKWISGQLV